MVLCSLAGLGRLEIGILCPFFSQLHCHYGGLRWTSYDSSNSHDSSWKRVHRAEEPFDYGTFRYNDGQG